MKVYLATVGIAHFESLMVGVYSTLEGAQRACDDKGDELIARGEVPSGATVLEFELDNGNTNLVMYAGMLKRGLN